MFRDTNALKQAFVAVWVMARVSASKTKPSRILIYGGRRPVLADPVAFCRPSMVSKAEGQTVISGYPRAPLTRHRKPMASSIGRRNTVLI